MTFDDLLQRLHKSVSDGVIPEKYGKLMEEFLQSYLKTRRRMGRNEATILPLMEDYYQLMVQQCANPVSFGSYHARVTEPFDYFSFGLNFWREVIDFETSHFGGSEFVPQMERQVAAGENVVFLANHQTEIDPQLISLILEKDHRELANEMIFVAGARVVSDPMAVPFSLGRNLICIHSKRYIDDPPEQRHEKQMHNARTMRVMQQILAEGGKAIYVAPSGGRDRCVDGEIRVAPFDAQAIEMFRLMARHSGRPCHFYPLALATHHLLPPPDEIQVGLGEPRHTDGGPILIAFGKELDQESYPGSDLSDKHERRAAFADYACSQVDELYRKLR